MEHDDIWKATCDLKQYSPEYDYWEKLTEAELYGGKTVKKQFEKCFKDATTDEKKSKLKITELSLVLWKKYVLFDQDDDEIYTDLYYELYSKVDSWACENLDETEIIYYMRMAS